MTLDPNRYQDLAAHIFGVTMGEVTVAMELSAKTLAKLYLDNDERLEPKLRDWIREWFNS